MCECVKIASVLQWKVRNPSKSAPSSLPQSSSHTGFELDLECLFFLGCGQSVVAVTFQHQAVKSQHRCKCNYTQASPRMFSWSCDQPWWAPVCYRWCLLPQAQKRTLAAADSPTGSLLATCRTHLANNMFKSQVEPGAWIELAQVLSPWRHPLAFEPQEVMFYV